MLDLPCPMPRVPLGVPLTLDPGAHGSTDTPHSSAWVTEGTGAARRRLSPPLTSAPPLPSENNEHLATGRFRENRPPGAVRACVASTQ